MNQTNELERSKYFKPIDENNIEENIEDIVEKEFEQQNNVIGLGFTLPNKNKNIKRFNIIGEIDKAYGFDVEEIYINYNIHFGNGWLLDTEEYDEEEKKLNILSSCTHFSKNDLKGNFHFNHPFELIILNNQDDDKDSEGVNMILEVSSEDNWGRFLGLGYGIINFPNFPGNFEKKISISKIKNQNDEEIFEYFLGGAKKLKNINDIISNSYNLGNNIKAPLNRINLETETTGEIILKFNIMTQSINDKELVRTNIREKNYLKKKNEIEENIIIGPQITKTNNGFTNKFST